MLYNLIFVVFLSGGERVSVPLKVNLTDESCLGYRDMVRASTDYLNDIEDKPTYDGKQIEFVEAECVTQKLFF